MKCRNCRQFKLHHDLFGYCKRYQCQALITENCNIIREVIPSTVGKKKSTLKQD